MISEICDLYAGQRLMNLHESIRAELFEYRNSPIVEISHICYVEHEYPLRDVDGQLFVHAR